MTNPREQKDLYKYWRAKLEAPEGKADLNAQFTETEINISISD